MGNACSDYLRDKRRSAVMRNGIVVLTAKLIKIRGANQVSNYSLQVSMRIGGTWWEKASEFHPCLLAFTVSRIIINGTRAFHASCHCHTVSSIDS